MTFIHPVSGNQPAANHALLSTTSMASSISGVTSVIEEFKFTSIEMQFDAVDHTFWCHLAPSGRPSFTPELLSDIIRVQQLIKEVAAAGAVGISPALHWVVLASRSPGVFSLGGDLGLFSDKIRTRDADGLRRYAYDCVEIGFRNASGYDANAISIGLAQGDALGGGFESLLSCDVLIAEKRARFGLPEVNFNLFAGMGAHVFLARKLGPAAAHRMVLSGKVYSAEAMHEAGIVDLVVEDGQGEAAVREYVREREPRFLAHSLAHKARRRVGNVTLGELYDVTEAWLEAAMQLTESDLHRMQLIIAMQDRSRRLLSAKQAAI